MKDQNGFTLIQLLITTLVTGSLITVAAPSFSSIIKDFRLHSQESSFITGLELARSEAIKKAHNVILCKSADGISCTTGGSAGWEQGWLIYADADSDKTLDSGETILKVQGALSGGNTITTNSFFTNKVIYKSTGFSTRIGTFWLCDDRGSSEGKAFIISASGRGRVEDTTQCTNQSS